MKIQLSASENYCPNWGIWEGVREIVQNWMDSRDAGFDGSVTFTGDKLTCVNNGATIEADHIALFGEGDKSDEARGAFREGLKIGMLALVRSGLGVLIRHGDLSWTASLEPGATGTRVLTLRSRRCKTSFDGVSVQISGLSKDTWEELRPRFRFTDKPGLIRDRAGDVFVKGIWVCRSRLDYGYDLARAETDRDRQIVDEWDLYYEVARQLVDAFRAGIVTPTRLLGMLEDGADDVRHVDFHLTAEDKERIEEAFVERHGSAALPVARQADADTLEHAGIRGVVATEELVKVTSGLRERVKEERAVTKKWTPDDITDAEAENLDRALALIKRSFPLEIVTFAGPDTMGRREGDVVQIARRVLGSFEETLKTLVEEVAHEGGAPDGSFDHKHALHDLYVGIIKQLTAN